MAVYATCENILASSTNCTEFTTSSAVPKRDRNPFVTRNAIQTFLIVSETEDHERVYSCNCNAAVLKSYATRQ